MIEFQKGPKHVPVVRDDEFEEWLSKKGLSKSTVYSYVTAVKMLAKKGILTIPKKEIKEELWRRYATDTVRQRYYTVYNQYHRFLKATKNKPFVLRLQKKITGKIPYQKEFETYLKKEQNCSETKIKKVIDSLRTLAYKNILNLQLSEFKQELRNQYSNRNTRAVYKRAYLEYQGFKTKLNLD